MTEQTTAESGAKDQRVAALATGPSPTATTTVGQRVKVGLHQIVIVGGGAAGLELATHLGNTLGRKGQADIVHADVTTVDQRGTEIE